MKKTSMAIGLALCLAPTAGAQTAKFSLPQSDANQKPPVTITLQDALQRARSYSVEYRIAVTDAGIAQLDKAQARAALLPSLTYNNQYIYTQGNGTPSGRFIANNGVHEYLSQGDVHEAIGPVPVAEYRRLTAAAAVARARSEIAARGLVVTLVRSFYSLLAAQQKYATAQTAAQEAGGFLKISQDLENGGEVAHADVIKAQIQMNDREKDLREAELTMESSRIALAVLIFPDFNQDFAVVDEHVMPPLPTLEEVREQAKHDNPDLAFAAAALQEARREVSSSRAAYFPTLVFDYFYGIDADHFATRSRGLDNLGYSATATLNIPIWNWGATHSRVKQSLLRASLAQLQLSAAQKKLMGDLQTLYSEAEAARDELDLLRKSADLAAQSLHLSTLRYQGGEATVLEVVDAQNTATLARNAYSDAEVRYRVALAGLQTLTGRM